MSTQLVPKRVPFEHSGVAGVVTVRKHTSAPTPGFTSLYKLGQTALADP
ncbi:MAG: hypothetical protein OXN95_10595 [bacterium]|nr:hypothetical protein [bacterium]